MTNARRFGQPIERPPVLFNQPIDANLNHRAPFAYVFTIHENYCLSKLYCMFDIYTTKAYAREAGDKDVNRKLIIFMRRDAAVKRKRDLYLTVVSKPSPTAGLIEHGEIRGRCNENNSQQDRASRRHADGSTR